MRSTPRESELHRPPVTGATLSLHRPLGGTLMLGAAVLLLLASVAEACIRSPLLAPYLPVASYGTPSRYFDFQMERLHRFAENPGPPECVFLGSSVVFRGIDPEAFESAYLAQTGDSIRCFNFGVRGLDPVSEAILARVLLEDYQPKLLVVGLEVANLASGAAEGLRDRFPATSWARHRDGRPSLEGWLIERSAALRTYLVYRNWMKAEYASELRRRTDANINTSIGPSGYGGFDMQSPGIAALPSPGDPQAEFFDLLRSYSLDPEQSDAVRDLARLREQTSVVLVEMPLHRTFLGFFGQGEADYLRGLEFIESTAAREGVLFLPTTLLDLIADGGWGNRNHLNQWGAREFGRWLGTEIGLAVQNGDLADPAAPIGSEVEPP